MVPGMYKHSRILINDKNSSFIYLHISSFIQAFTHPLIIHPSDINVTTPAGYMMSSIQEPSNHKLQFKLIDIYQVPAVCHSSCWGLQAFRGLALGEMSF